jgi:hypothetical protein
MDAPANMRCCIVAGSDREIMAAVQRVLSRANSFVELFLRGGDDFVRNQEVQSARLAIHESPANRFANAEFAQSVTRWSPFYLIIREPNVNLFRTSVVVVGGISN